MKQNFKMVPQQRQKMQLRKKLLLAAGVASIVGLVATFIVIFNFTDVKDVSAQIKFQGSNFENGINDWTSVGDGKWSITTTSAEVRSGSSALKLETEASKEGGMFNNKLIIEAPATGTNYITVSAYVIASHCKNEGTVGLIDSKGGVLRSMSEVCDSTWTKVSGTFQVKNGEKYYPIVYGRRSNPGPPVHIIFDDLVAYAGTSANEDVTAPDKPTDLKITSSGTSVPMLWKEGTDAGSGIDGSLVLRADGVVSSSPSVLRQSVYENGSSIGNWKVVYNGTAKGAYTDITESASTYTYLIYNRDLACNYSAPARALAMGNTANTLTLPSGNTNAEAFYVAASSTCIIPSSSSFTFKNGGIDGTLINNETIAIASGGSLTVGATGTYIHKTGNSGVGVVIPAATWSNGATCVVEGPASPKNFNVTLQGLDQSFSNFIWNASLQTVASTFNNVTIRGNFEVKNTGSSNIAIQDSLKVGGNFSQSGGNINFNGNNSFLVFNGNGAQQLATTAGTRTGTVNISLKKNGGVVNLANDLEINGKLTLWKGKLVLGDNDMAMVNKGTCPTFSKDAFVVTNGKGSLKIQNLGSTGNPNMVWFPVGSNEESYTPVAIKNTGTTDEFRARVHDKVYENYDENDNAIGTSVASNVVNKTWIINENVKGGSVVTVTTQWNEADEVTGFMRSNAFVAHYTGGKWDRGMPGIASGAGPYTLAMENVTSFSPFSVGDGLSALPVDLIAFTAERENNNEVTLKWTTASEENNDRFEIERSNDGKKWLQIGKISGFGTTTNQQNYTYNDRAAATLNWQQAYYRLRQVDFNGDFEYSPIKRVILASSLLSNGDAKAWYNQSEDKVYASINNSSAQPLKVTMISITGQTVGRQNIPAQSGVSKISFEMAGLAKGMYSIILEGGEKTRALKVVKN